MATTTHRCHDSNGAEKTIEGDLFAAFVAAGAISKANSDDPKKSAFVRCARTDKGVHAAGNTISLKMIVEDSDIVERINSHLPKQIRVWGIERTSGSFSCYNLCDSRIYEYLIPSFTLLPPHPRSFLGRKIRDLAGEEGKFGYLHERQKDVMHFWDDSEDKYIKPIIEPLDASVREAALAAVFQDVGEYHARPGSEAALSAPITDPDTHGVSLGQGEREAFGIAYRKLKSAYLEAKKSYRISTSRLSYLRKVLSLYHGTHNFHNYTVQRSFSDASAKRHIKSFIAEEPVLIGGTEWLSLKVHGQSFMMHQIRKMVSMAALMVRTGCPLERIQETYGPTTFAIPKAPGLGLLLERPLFEEYNKRAVETLQREPINFDKYREAIEEFKQKEIYDHIFQEDEKEAR